MADSASGLGTMPGSASLMVGVILRSSKGVANWARASADTRLAATAAITASWTRIVAITRCDLGFVKGDRAARAGLVRTPRQNCGARTRRTTDECNDHGQPLRKVCNP